MKQKQKEEQNVVVNIYQKIDRIYIQQQMGKQVQPAEFKLYPKRFLIVFLFSLAQIMTPILINTLTPIAKYLQTIYGLDPIIINLGALLFTLMHPVFTFPAAFVIDTYGTKVGIAFGSALCLLGTACRMLVNQSFYFVIVGQVIAGIGRPFILNCQAKISANWFSAQKRGSVTQLLSLILNVSLIIGIFIPGFFFSKYEVKDTTQENIQLGKTNTYNVMLFETIMAAICYIPNILFQQSNPPTPSSRSGEVKRETFKISMKKIIKNKNFLLILFGFGCYFGIFNGLSIILSYLLHPWFTQNLAIAVGIVGGSPVISGIIGVLIFSPLQRKSGKYKKFMIICMLGSISAMVFFYPLLQTNILALASLVSAYNSFFLIPLVPIMLELSCETAFPVGQGTAVGLLFAMGNLFGFIFGAILSVIVKGQTKEQSLYGLIFCFCIFIVGLILTFILKQQKNRQIYEKSRSLLDESKHTESILETDEDIDEGQQKSIQ